MTNLKLDLHGFRHHEVPLKVENFLYLNQENMPILIICGNSQKMINIVKDVLEGIDCNDGKVCLGSSNNIGFGLGFVIMTANTW